MQSLTSKDELGSQFENELLKNILPFWQNYSLDRENGGFYGAMTNDLRIHNEVERSAVLCSRILWTFSTAAQTWQNEPNLQVAKWAFSYLVNRFWDKQYQGVFWSLDRYGEPINPRKHTYAQGFAIYALAAYHRTTGEKSSLSLAQILFEKLETHAHDDLHGGNIECRGRDWTSLADMRLSDKEINSSKSMNTMLHLMEAYAALIQIWPDNSLKTKLSAIIQLFLHQVINPETLHQRLFFDERWNSLSDQISYGHDIETSWLLMEAAEALGDQALIEQTRSLGVQMAHKIYDQALESDGGIIYEEDTLGHQNVMRHWWAHAEAVVGFYNAWQKSSEDIFYQASSRVWTYIQKHFIDHENGDWFKLLNADGTPIQSHYKISPWECPYHAARMCFEMIKRTGEKASNL